MRAARTLTAFTSQKLLAKVLSEPELVAERSEPRMRAALHEALEHGHHTLVAALLDHIEEQSSLAPDGERLTVSRLVQSIDIAALFVPKPPGSVSVPIDEFGLFASLELRRKEAGHASSLGSAPPAAAPEPLAAREVSGALEPPLWFEMMSELVDGYSLETSTSSSKPPPPAPAPKDAPPHKKSATARGIELGRVHVGLLDLFLWSVASGRAEMVATLWRRCPDPTRAALVASDMCVRIRRLHAHRLAVSRAREKLQRIEDECNEAVTGVLDNVRDSVSARAILLSQYSTLGIKGDQPVNLLGLGIHLHSQNFVSHAWNQVTLDERRMHGMYA